MHTHKKYNAPRIKESKGIQLLTSIWLVPFIAMVIALWLAYQYYSKIGPTIEINFKSNAGLVANQSQLKLRDVTIGMVTKISLSKDGKGVTVQVKVNKDVEKYLNEKAKFWIVHADVGSHGVSGLDTLLSGSYIELYGVKEQKTKYTFDGLSKAHIDKNAEGKYYLLSAPNSNNISEGSHVYYRMIKVGSVERVAISPDGKKVNFTIFVEGKYTSFINDQSQFYTNSSFSLDFSKGKVDMSLASVSQLVHGGISIYTPLQSIGQKNTKEKKEKHVFPLYKNLSEMKAKHLMTGAQEKVYAFNFKEEHKLEIGSPIEFNGFQVGYVTDIQNKFILSTKKVNSKIFAILYTKAFTNSAKESDGAKVIKKLVEHGLRASIEATLPVIGSDFINLTFDNTQSRTIDNNTTYPLFPTIKKEESSNLLHEVEALVVKIEKLPLENVLISATKLLDDNNKPIQNLLKDLRKTINNFNITVNNMNKFTEQESLQKLPEELTITMHDLSNTLQRVQELTQEYGADSTFAAELALTLKELTLTAESMGRISLKLEKKPNILILGDD